MIPSTVALASAGGSRGLRSSMSINFSACCSVIARTSWAPGRTGLPFSSCPKHHAAMADGSGRGTGRRARMLDFGPSRRDRDDGNRVRGFTSAACGVGCGPSVLGADVDASMPCTHGLREGVLRLPSRTPLHRHRVVFATNAPAWPGSDSNSFCKPRPGRFGSRRIACCGGQRRVGGRPPTH